MASVITPTEDTFLCRRIEVLGRSQANIDLTQNPSGLYTLVIADSVYWPARDFKQTIITHIGLKCDNPVIMAIKAGATASHNEWTGSSIFMGTSMLVPCPNGNTLAYSSGEVFQFAIINGTNPGPSHGQFSAYGFAI